MPTSVEYAELEERRDWTHPIEPPPTSKELAKKATKLGEDWANTFQEEYEYIGVAIDGGWTGRVWNLVSGSKRTPEDYFERLAKALQIRYDKDKLYQTQWLQLKHREDGIDLKLSRIKTIPYEREFEAFLTESTELPSRPEPPTNRNLLDDADLCKALAESTGTLVGEVCYIDSGPPTGPAPIYDEEEIDDQIEDLKLPDKSSYEVIRRYRFQYYSYFITQKQKYYSALIKYENDLKVAFAKIPSKDRLRVLDKELDDHILSLGLQEEEDDLDEIDMRQQPLDALFNKSSPLGRYIEEMYTAAVGSKRVEIDIKNPRLIELSGHGKGSLYRSLYTFVNHILIEIIRKLYNDLDFKELLKKQCRSFFQTDSECERFFEVLISRSDGLLSNITRLITFLFNRSLTDIEGTPSKKDTVCKNPTLANPSKDGRTAFYDVVYYIISFIKSIDHIRTVIEEQLYSNTGIVSTASKFMKDLERLFRSVAAEDASVPTHSDHEGINVNREFKQISADVLENSQSGSISTNEEEEGEEEQGEEEEGEEEEGEEGSEEGGEGKEGFGNDPLSTRKNLRNPTDDLSESTYDIRRLLVNNVIETVAPKSGDEASTSPSRLALSNMGDAITILYKIFSNTQMLDLLEDIRLKTAELRILHQELDAKYKTPEDLPIPGPWTDIDEFASFLTYITGQITSGNDVFLGSCKIILSSLLPSAVTSFIGILRPSGGSRTARRSREKNRRTFRKARKHTRA